MQATKACIPDFQITHSVQQHILDRREGGKTRGTQAEGAPEKGERPLSLWFIQKERQKLAQWCRPIIPVPQNSALFICYTLPSSRALP